MDNLITETNARLNEIITNLTTIKEEYENKLDTNNKEIDNELAQVKKYKEEFLVSKQKIEKMNSDIEGFEEDYKKLVERFKDDELANILIAANKEISAKIDERRKKIAKDKVAMNELVELAENSKNRLVKLTAEKKALELCLARILDSHEYYSKSLSPIISYSEEHRNDLCSCFFDENAVTPFEGERSEINFDSDDELETEEVLYEDAIDFDSDDLTEVTESDLEEIGLDLDGNMDDDVIEEEEEIEEDSIEEDDEEITEESELFQEDDEEEFNEEDEDLEESEDTEEVEEKEESNEELELDDIPSSIYDLNDSLDLESLLEFED